MPPKRSLEAKLSRLAELRDAPETEELHHELAKHLTDKSAHVVARAAAVIEARSCERFTCLLAVVEKMDPEVAAILSDLGPAEKRHWEMFHRLAARGAEPSWFESHWGSWLEHEDRVIRELGDSPRVHG